MKPTKTILLVLLVSFGLNTVAQVAINTNEKASNNKSAIQADAAIASGQKPRTKALTLIQHSTILVFNLKIIVSHQRI